MSKLDMGMGMAMFGPEPDRSAGVKILVDYAAATSVCFEVVRDGDTVSLAYPADHFDESIAPLLLEGAAEND